VWSRHHLPIGLASATLPRLTVRDGAARFAPSPSSAHHVLAVASNADANQPRHSPHDGHGFARQAYGQSEVVRESFPGTYRRRTTMATYISLSNFTDQGIRSVKDTTKRYEAVREMGKKFNVTVKDIYWTIGSHDLVGIFEAPDDAAITAFALSIGMGGNIRTQTLRAFSKDEINGVLGRLA
jgi:uncharacterized protein with GYD domain